MENDNAKTVHRSHNMEYNSQKEHLQIAEYGRNVQNLVAHAKQIEDDKERQHFIEKVINLMQQMHPYNKNIAEYREKLWRHIFRIAQYDLDVTPPGGTKPTPEETLRPEKLSYPERETKFRHYGHNVQILIRKAIEMEDGHKKDEFVRVIASYMKLAYRTWNKDHYVNDEIVKNDLKQLAEGKLKVNIETSLDTLTTTSRKRKRNNMTNNQNNKSRSNRNRRRR